MLFRSRPTGEKLVAVNNNYTIKIPPSGTLDIQGKNLMLNWYVQQARYANGAKLNEGGQHTKDEQGIYLWDMGVNADGSECWYVVGQRKDIEGVEEKKMGLPPFKVTPHGNK